jgi:hypothetical protein
MSKTKPLHWTDALDIGDRAWTELVSSRIAAPQYFRRAKRSEHFSAISERFSGLSGPFAATSIA